MRMRTKMTFQPVFRNIERHLSSSVDIRIDKGQHLTETFHYHPQVELILLRNCIGNIILGTQVCPIDQDSIFLIGKNTPHGFQYRHDGAMGEGPDPHAIVVQFDEHFMGKDFFAIPEFHNIKRLLTEAQNGLLIPPERRPYVAKSMERMLAEFGLRKLLILLEILGVIQEDVKSQKMVLDQGQVRIPVDDDSRISMVWDYTSKHFDQAIRIEEVAFHINLTKESFCRFFKTKTNMTYLEYLFFYRIDKAKSMIMENRLSIKEIGYACGFLSLSNFYYQFKKIVHCSPLEYQSQLFSKMQS